jgi:hypothetical protein
MLQSFIVVKKELQNNYTIGGSSRFLITVVFRIVHMNGNVLACGEERT